MSVSPISPRGAAPGGVQGVRGGGQTAQLWSGGRSELRAEPRTRAFTPGPRVRPISRYFHALRLPCPSSSRGTSAHRECGPKASYAGPLSRPLFPLQSEAVLRPSKFSATQSPSSPSQTLSSVCLCPEARVCPLWGQIARAPPRPLPFLPALPRLLQTGPAAPQPAVRQRPSRFLIVAVAEVPASRVQQRKTQDGAFPLRS